MSVLERERRKLEESRSNYQKNLQKDRDISLTLSESNDRAQARLLSAKESLRRLQRLQDGNKCRNEGSTIKSADVESTKSNGDRGSHLYAELCAKYNNEFPKGNPFIVACQFNRLKDVKSFIESGRVDVNTTTGKNSKGKNAGYTALMTAVEEEHYEIVKFLLGLPTTDISVVRGLWLQRDTLAARSGKASLDVLNLLLAHKSCTRDVLNKQTDDCLGHTPTDYAYSNTGSLRKEITALLKSKGGKCTLFKGKK